MPYATATDFINHFGTQEALELSNLDNPSAVAVNTAIITQAISRADSLIDGYLSRFLPLQPPIPSLVKALSLDISRYYLDRYLAREDVRKRYEDALKTLMAIAKGDISLGLGGTPQSVISGGMPQFSSGDLVYSDRALGGY